MAVPPIQAHEVADELDRWGRGVERFTGELMQEEYLHGAGLKEELELAPIYERWEHLFSLEAVQRARQLADSAPPGELARRARFILEFTVSGHLARAVKDEVDRLGTEEARGTVEVDGESIPYRAVSVRMANEPDRARRMRLQQARERFTGRLNPLREQIAEQQAARVAGALGYPSYADMYKVLKAIDYDALGRTVAAFLERTEGAYRERFGSALRERTGVGLGEAEKHDVAWLLRAGTFDPLFPAGRLVEALRSTLRGLGIEPDRQPNVKLDTESRPRKSPRAFCAPVHVPGDVRLVILPHGGQDDYHALMHEAGHAQHFAHTRPELPPEFRYLGDNSVTECFAFLFDYLVSDAAWLEACLGLTPQRAADYVAFSQLDRLYFLRRYAGKLLYELELHRARSVPSMAARYREILTAATGIRYGEVDYLADVDDAFYVAEYLRAWALEVMLREALRTRFGRAWFTRPAAGEFLRELWAHGQRYDGDELGRLIGYSGVDFEPLTAELTAPAADGR